MDGVRRVKEIELAKLGGPVPAQLRHVAHCHDLGWLEVKWKHWQSTEIQ